VFLAGPVVYKVKKPVAPGFLDFTTLEKRLHFCREEVRLNRRLAPDVYLGVVPVARTAVGLKVEAAGEVVEWAVKMRRLPDDATLLAKLRRGEADAPLVAALARRVAAFHRGAESNDRTAAAGRFDAVSHAVRDVFDRADPTVGCRDVFDRVRQLADEALARSRPLIEARAARGMPRDCHGDLRLDHVYHFPDRPPPGDLVVIDCIEFSEQLRYTDPVADMAFAVMDLAFNGRRDLAQAFTEAYFLAADDAEGRALVPLYTAYRAAVRGMVDGLLAGEPEVPEEDRTAALARSRAHWLLALGELEAPSRRPCLVLVGGLPGTGKSTLARALSAAAGFDVVRSDVVRKELAGLTVDAPTPPALRDALYAAGTTDRTYEECLRRAEQLVADGRRVLVDATFREERHRRAFLDLAVRCGVSAVFLVCEASDGAVRARLDARRGDASDADWAVFQQTAALWEQPGGETRRVTRSVSTEGPAEDGLARALDVVRDLGC
jgi:aminoglycoside phosphotransferase family enzyme/predicted kinase